MNLSEFVSMETHAVTKLVQAHDSRLGVALPLNGTRRWYLDTYQVGANSFLEHWQHYQQVMLERLLTLAVMMFEDGVKAVYTPIVGRDMAERGAAYMKVITESVVNTASDATLAFYEMHDIEASCYGELTLLSEQAQQYLHRLETTRHRSHYLRYGVMADRPLPDLIERTLQLAHQNGTSPSQEQLLSDYYGGDAVPVGLWIGCDQPTVFDVPGVVYEQTALYFLQFPTPYLDRPTWRRLLYDYLFIRGDSETLYPDNISTERRITGLGVRHNGYWLPSEL